MDDSDSETESLRAEQGKRAQRSQPAPDASSLSLGSMIRGPIGREGADDRASGSEGADADRRAAEEPEA
jgi:hypothetical protein